MVMVDWKSTTIMSHRITNNEVHSVNNIEYLLFLACDTVSNQNISKRTATAYRIVTKLDVNKIKVIFHTTFSSAFP